MIKVTRNRRTSGPARSRKRGKAGILRNLSRLINYDLFENIQWARSDTSDTSNTSSTSVKSVTSDIPATELAKIREELASVVLPRQPKPQAAHRSGELPSVEELYRLFDLYNAIHFDNALPQPTIEYSTRMLAAGSCEPVRRRIKIGVRYHQIFREELEDTLKHEMIHLVHYHHDKRFKAKAAELGVSVHAKFHPDLKRQPRYLYQCPACNAQYPRQKRLRETSCGSCSGGAFDSRFKLRLVRNAQDRKNSGVVGSVTV